MRSLGVALFESHQLIANFSGAFEIFGLHGLIEGFAQLIDLGAIGGFALLQFFEELA